MIRSTSNETSTGAVSSARRAGFTLIELMLAATMLSIVMYMTLDSLTRQNKTALVTDQIVEVQNNVRAVSALLEREIRMAGFMVGNSVGVCGVDETTASDQLFISETEAIVPDDERAGDLGARLGASQNWTPGWNETSDPGTISLDSDTTDLDGDGSYFYDNDGNGTNEADFRVNGGFIAGDIANPDRGTVCGIVTGVSTNSITLEIEAGQLRAHVASSDAPEDIVIVPAAHYRVNGAVGRLERNQDLLVNGVDDFQISFFFDNDDDGVLDLVDPPANHEERGATAATVYDPADENNSALREVRFSIAIRTRSADLDFNLGQFEARENRTPIAGNDNFRRRVIQGFVRPRNIGGEGSI